MDKLIGFAPDRDPMTPGVFTDCQHVIPFGKGFQGAPTGAAASVAVLPAACRGAVVATRLDDGRRIFAGTQTKLYELIAGAWTDRSAGTYTGSVDSRWSFAQFGDTTIASNLVDAMQASASGAFAAIAGAPKAKIVVSASNNFVIAFNTNDGTFGVVTDGWWCCAQGNQTDWVPSVSTGAQRGRLIATPGGIQAALPLGDYVVAYKTRGVYLGQYSGSGGITWAWSNVRGSNDCGAVGSDAVCDIGGAHFIIGDDDFWIFDGTAPVSVGDEVREWFRANSSTTYRYRAKAIFDRQRQIVWVCFPSAASSGVVDSAIAFHIKSKTWGRDDFTMEAGLTYINPGVTIDGLNAYSSTIDGLPGIGFDSQYWLAGGKAFAYFNSAHQLVVKSGATADSSITTGDFGDDDAVTMFDRYRMRFLSEPDSAMVAAYFKFDEGKALQPGPIETMYDGQFNPRQAGRFHRVRLDMSGPHQETAHDARLLPEYER